MKKFMAKQMCDISFALALIIKLFGAGFKYFLTLDDYIQYGCYPLYENLHKVYFEIGTAANRPLSAFLDPWLWGAFFSNMAFALLLMGVIYFLSAKLFDKVLKEMDFSITPFFYAVYLFLPLNFEGTYWISASSRVVVGLLFASLCAYLLITYIKSGKKYILVPYAICALASFGFYESITAFSGLLQGLIILKFALEEKRYKRLWLLIVPLLCAMAVLVYYKLVGGIYAGNRASEFNLDNLGERLRSLASQFGYIFTAGLYRTTFVGFIDGIRTIYEQGAWGILIALLILAVSFLCSFFGKREKISSPKAWICISAGLLLTVLPLLPHILVPDVWLTYRAVVVSIIGLCVMFAPLLSKIFKNERIRCAAIFVVMTVFLTGCINELYTYKAVNELDLKILNEITDKLDDETLSKKKDVLLVFEKEVYTPQTSFYKDHVKSVFYTDWSSTGAIRARAKNLNIKSVTPVYSLDGVETEGKQIIYIDQFFNVTEGNYER